MYACNYSIHFTGCTCTLSFFSLSQTSVESVITTLDPDMEHYMRKFYTVFCASVCMYRKHRRISRTFLP